LLVLKGNARMQFDPRSAWSLSEMSEIIFEVNEDDVDGGYTATALGYGICTQAKTVEELRTMVKDAVACYFDEAESAPKIIRLHFVRDEVLHFVKGEVLV